MNENERNWCRVNLQIASHTNEQSRLYFYFAAFINLCYFSIFYSILASFICGLFNLYEDLYFTYLEINPLGNGYFWKQNFLFWNTEMCSWSFLWFCNSQQHQVPCVEVWKWQWYVFELFIHWIKNEEMKNSLEGTVKAVLKNVKIALLEQNSPWESLDHGHLNWLIPQGACWGWSILLSARGNISHQLLQWCLYGTRCWSKSVICLCTTQS